MGTKKVAKPDTVSDADVKKSERRINKLQRQVAAANRRNTRLIEKLTATQAETQAQTEQQITLLESAVTAANTPAEEVDEGTVTAVNNWSALTTAAQADETDSAAEAKRRAVSQADAYKRSQLVTRALRASQFS